MKLALAALLVACGHPAQLVEPPSAPVPWCFSLVAERFGERHAARACADSADLCDFARERAIFFAGLAHFVEIGSCSSLVTPR